jgi:putative membrane protein
MKFKALLLIGALSTPVFADTKAKLSDDETHALQHVHHVNQMEIDLAKMASKNGTSAISKYTAEIIKDHSQADTEVSTLGKTKNVKVTTETDEDKQADKDMKSSMDHLKSLKGKDFDKEYLSMMYDGHTKEVSKLDAAISSGSDADVKALLTKIKPVVQKHADDAKELNKPNS